jgi:hypothetical protein
MSYGIVSDTRDILIEPPIQGMDLMLLDMLLCAALHKSIIFQGWVDVASTSLLAKYKFSDPDPQPWRSTLARGRGVVEGGQQGRRANPKRPAATHRPFQDPALMKYKVTN